MRRSVTAVSVAFALILVGAIAAGLFDPLPTGEPSWTGVPIALSIEATPQIVWREPPLLAGRGHLRLPIALQAGDPDAGAGLVVGNREAWLGIAVSPLGYVRLWEETQAGVIEHLPWQPWPHVRRDGTRNEIDVTFRERELDVFVNRERLWTGEAPASVTGMAYWGHAYGNPAIVLFGPLRLYEIENR